MEVCFIGDEDVCVRTFKVPSATKSDSVFAKRRMGGSIECVLDFFGSSVEYSDVVQQGLQDTRKHARGSEVSRDRKSRRSQKMRGEKIIFNTKDTPTFSETFSHPAILFEMLSPCISNQQVSAPGVDTSKQTVRGRRRRSRRETS